MTDITCPGEPGFDCVPGIFAKDLCHRCYFRQWRKANREKVAEYNRQWRLSNPDYGRRWQRANREKDAEYGRRWREANRESKNEHSRRLYADNREKAAERNRRWRQANPEKHAERQRRRRAHLRKRLTVPFTIDQLDQRMSMFGYLCWMCGVDATEVDHVKPIDAGGPHCLSNLRPACRSCNASKGARWPFRLTA